MSNSQGMTRQEALALGENLDYCPIRDCYWKAGEMPPLSVVETAINPVPESSGEPILTEITPVIETAAELTAVEAELVVDVSSKKIKKVI